MAAKAILDKIDQAIERSIDAGAPVSFTIQGHTIVFNTLDAMMRARAVYAREARSEEGAGLFLARLSQRLS